MRNCSKTIAYINMKYLKVQCKKTLKYTYTIFTIPAFEVYTVFFWVMNP